MTSSTQHFDSFVVACQGGDDDAIRLLRRFTDYDLVLRDITNSRKTTLLHVAVEKGCYESVKFLIEEAKLDPDDFDDNTKSARDIAQTNKGRADTREIWQFIKAISSEGQRASKRPKRGAAARASMHWAPNNRNRELSQAKQESLKEFAGEQLQNEQPPKPVEQNEPEAERLLAEWSAHTCRIMQLVLKDPSKDGAKRILRSSLNLNEVLSTLLKQEKQSSSGATEGYSSPLLENILQVLRLQIPMRYGNWLTAAQQPPTDLRDWAIAVLAVQRDMKQLTVQTEGAMQLLVGKQQEAQALMQTMDDELTEVQQGLTQTEEEICRGQESGQGVQSEIDTLERTLGTGRAQLQQASVELTQARDDEFKLSQTQREQRHRTEVQLRQAQQAKHTHEQKLASHESDGNLFSSLKLYLEEVSRALSPAAAHLVATCHEAGVRSAADLEEDVLD